MMESLLPRIPQGVDMARRFTAVGGTQYSFEEVFDWFADGVMLVREDAQVLYVNRAMQAIARRRDGIVIRRGMIQFAGTVARDRFARVMAELRQVREHHAGAATGADFPAGRGAGKPPYLLAIRPLSIERTRSAASKAAAIVLVRDPSRRNALSLCLLREVLGLTDAEAALARELEAGTRLENYARARQLSIHTVYSHLRSIKAKTGCGGLGELIARLNDLRVPLRIG